MDKDELRAWLRLSLTEGVGNEAARRLLMCFDNPQAVFEQPPHLLRQVVTPTQVQALMSEPDSLALQCVRTQHWLDHPPQTHAHALWTYDHASYPVELLRLPDPPILLYVAGQTKGRLGDAIAMVGSRNPTPQGAQTALQFAEALRAAGLCVVSGMALGVDGAAHQGALRAQNTVDQTTDPTKEQWRTVAVVGTGLDLVYPRQHQTLAQAIAERGLLISEYPLGTPPLAHNFPKRNRLIAALGLGTLVVEAALKSGSLITANMALELGRDVLAIPGSIHATQSKGCHALIRQGAELVSTTQDVLESLQLLQRFPAHLFEELLASGNAKGLTADEIATYPLLLHMDFAPVSLDDLQARSGLDTATLQSLLLGMELDGKIGRLPGGLFQRLGKT